MPDPLADQLVSQMVTAFTLNRPTNPQRTGRIPAGVADLLVAQRRLVSDLVPTTKSCKFPTRLGDLRLKHQGPSMARCQFPTGLGDPQRRHKGQTTMQKVARKDGMYARVSVSRPPVTTVHNTLRTPHT